MRKQKVFNRVSAWLLVWTMVLSALAGNVTVRAEEPEEVDVQIEADTNVQTEEDADMQIEANQGPEDDESVTGLVVKDDIGWYEDGPCVNEGAEIKKAIEADLYERTLWLGYREDENSEPNVVSEENISVQFNGEAAGDKVKYQSNEQNPDLIDFTFNAIGEYTVSYTPDGGEESSITINVVFPEVGFYSTGVKSEETLIRNVSYKEGAEDTFYMILWSRENTKLDLDSITYKKNGDDIDITDISEYFTITEPEVELSKDPKNPTDYLEEEDYVYTVKINENMKEEFRFDVEVQKTDVMENGEDEPEYTWGDPYPISGGIDISPKMVGLVLKDNIVGWNDNNPHPFEGDAENPPADIKKETWSELQGITLWLGYREDESFEPDVVSEENISVLFNGEDAGDKVKYWSNEQNDELIDFEFPEVGDYIVSYTPDGGEASTITIHVDYPEYGFYTTAEKSADEFVRDGSDCEYNDDSRTFYLLKRDDDVTSELIDVCAVWVGENKTEAFIEKDELTEGNGWKITIKPGCQQDFDLIAYIQNEGEDEPYEKPICLCYGGEKATHKSGSDGPDKAFSGCMLTEWGYRSGLPFWENNCTPDNIEYWVHGDSVQDVLDKLAALKSVEVTENGQTKTVSITPTGYYQINMSCYTGNKNEEENQETEQIIMLPEGAKGILMYSSSQLEAAWGSEDTSFDFEDGEPVIVYTGFDEINTETNEIDEKMACYLEFVENGEDKSGWYEVTQVNGVYVYDSKTPVTATYNYEKDNFEKEVYVPNPKDWWSDELREEWNLDEETFEDLFERISAKYQTIPKYFSWPDLVLDLTNGPASVKLDGQWLEYDGTDEKTGVTIQYSNRKAAEFEVTVCGTKITNEDAEDGKTITVTEKVTDEEGDEKEITKTTVTFKYVPCDHKGQSGVTKDAKAATCTEAGYTGDTYCADCDAKAASGTAIPATGHKWDAGKVTKEATTTEKGVKTYTCQVCKQTKTEDIPVLEKKPDPTPAQKPQGTKVPDSTGNTYKVTSDPQAKEPTVEYTAPKKGAKGTVKVPDSVTVDGVNYKVTAIADNAFKGNKKITKVTVGKNITSIGKNAFSGCSKLKTVTVGANVEKIGDNAFKGCAAVTKITLPAKVQKIGKNAFDGCKKLKTITIKSTKLTAKNISKGAFKGVTTKTTIKVPKSKVKAYKKLFQSKGLSKKVKVKA